MRSSKSTLILGLLVLAVLVIFASTRTWVEIALAEGTATVGTVSVTGQTAGTGVMPMGIALLAVSVTLALAGRVMRAVLAALSVLMGCWIAFTSWVQVGFDRASLVATASTELSQVTGLGASEHLDVVRTATRTLWPTVSGAAGVVIAGLGIAVFIVGRRWKSGGQRYTSGVQAQPQGPSAAPDRISDWDSLSDGSDPSLDADERSALPESPGDGSTDASENR